MEKKRECVSRSSRNDGEGGGSATKVEERIKDRTCRIARQVHATSKPFDRSWRDARNAGENGKSARERARERERERKKERKKEETGIMDREKLMGLLSFFKVIDRCRRNSVV